MGQRETAEAADAVVISLREMASTPPGKRHRPASELRLREVGAEVPRLGTAESLPDALRVGLWEIVFAFLFAPHAEFDRWTDGVRGRPSVRRVWLAPPISGVADLIPEDVATLLQNWFSLVEPGDAYAFIEAVHDNLEVPSQHRFAAACNAALERGLAQHRFVLRRLAPIASKADAVTLERALEACRSAGLVATEGHLLEAMDRLSHRPEPDSKGAVHEAVRAVHATALVLTGDRHPSLEETLEDLEAMGYFGGALKAAYGGLFAYLGGARGATTEDARLILVMCAGFVSHLAAKVSADRPDADARR